MKTHSAFFNDRIQSLLRDNQKTNQAASKQAAEFIGLTKPWMVLGHDELRGLAFSSTLRRSWFVLSDGCCPSCGDSVPMYNWIYDPFNAPWKMKCPHCSELFPKNDFGTYYDSGLDDKGYFRHEKADKSLLVNEDGTDFGVDDGNGWYDEEGRRYMFIGAYLSHARWKTQVKDGAYRLSFSYVLTGNMEYAYRTAILLDSIAEFWPDFDFYTQGLMYEQEFKSHGYVNYWVDSNREARTFALAYDQVFDALSKDAGFESIVGKTFADFSRRVEHRILQDSLDNVRKIHSNPPETEFTVSILKSVLNHCDAEISEYIDDLIKLSTAVDGLSGESGLAGYAAITPRALSDLLCLYSNTDEDFLLNIFKKHPQLYKTYRFHIDTWYDASYYPGIGDNSLFAMPYEKYTGLFSHQAPPTSCMHRTREWFALQLSEYFNDPDIARTIYSSYGAAEGSFDHDLYIADPPEYDRMLRNIIDGTGPDFTQTSINYNEWRLSVLHAGSGGNKTMVAMPYDSGKNHTHHDALSLHIFAKGLNVTPDYGYPPVNYGGWKTKEALWYKHPAAHNQVVIDGKRHVNMPEDGDGMFHRYPEHGENLMFCDGSFVKAAYNSAPEYNDAKRNERLVAVIETENDENYILDISRTEGGNRHTRFLHGTYSELTTAGLDPIKTEDYHPDDTIMHNFTIDESPASGWTACFRAFADENHAPLDREIYMKYTGLSPEAAAGTCESWVDITRMSQVMNERTGTRTVWIPTVYETMKGPRSRFAGIIEVFEERPSITEAKFIEHDDYNDFDCVMKISYSEGITDYILACDPENIRNLAVDEPALGSDALLAVIRFRNNGFEKATVCSGSFVEICGTRYDIDSADGSVEFL